MATREERLAKVKAEIDGFTRRQWQFYSKCPNEVEVLKALNEALFNAYKLYWQEAAKATANFLPVDRDAVLNRCMEEVMVPVMDKYRREGAYDTEPETFAWNTLRVITKGVK